MNIDILPKNERARAGIARGLADSERTNMAQRFGMDKAQVSFQQYKDGMRLILTHPQVLEAWRWGFRRRVRRGLAQNIHRHILAPNGVEKEDYTVVVSE